MSEQVHHEQETKESPAEQGASFLAQARQTMIEGLKFYFRVPDFPDPMDKIINVFAKTLNPAGSALFAKAIMDLPQNPLISEEHKQSVALAIAALAALPVFVSGLALQYQKQFEKIGKKLHLES